MSLHYRIEVEGELGPHWSRWFDGLTLVSTGDGNTTIAGRIGDQAALHGVLDRIRDLGLVLRSVECEAPGTSTPQSAAPTQPKQRRTDPCLKE